MEYAKLYASKSHTAMYSTYRPSYLPAMFEYIMEYVQGQVGMTSSGRYEACKSSSCVSHATFCRKHTHTQRERERERERESNHQLVIPHSVAIHSFVSMLTEELFIFSHQLAPPLSLAVDVGCGTGISTRPLVEYFNQVIACDISQSQIEKAKEQSIDESITYR